MDKNANKINDSNIINDREYTTVSLDQLIPFSGVMYDEKGNETPVSGNPFYVPDDYLDDDSKASDNESRKSMRSLHASIEQEGVLTPLLVRPSKDNKSGKKDTYEILSGYRRKKVCDVLTKTHKTQTKFQTVPVIILDCDDDVASSIITSANVQRREIGFLDTIISCGRMYRALRHRGERSDKDLTAKIVANVLGLTPRSVKRYSSLLNLPEFMLQLVGNKVQNEDGEKRLSIRAGEALYGVDRAKLDVINRIMQNDDNKIVSFEAATALKKACRENPDITDEEIEQIITGNTPAKPDETAENDGGEETAGRKRRFSLASDGGLTKAINKYCHNMSDQQIDDLLSDLLTKWGDSAEAAGAAGTTTEDAAAASTENTQSE